MPRRYRTSALSRAAEAAYIRSPYHCPFCGWLGVTAGDHSPGQTEIYQSVSCERCHRQWTECYRLISIDLEEDCDVRNCPPWFDPR